MQTQIRQFLEEQSDHSRSSLFTIPSALFGVITLKQNTLLTLLGIITINFESVQKLREVTFTHISQTLFFMGHRQTE